MKNSKRNQLRLAAKEQARKSRPPVSKYAAKRQPEPVTKGTSHQKLSVAVDGAPSEYSGFERWVK